MSTVDCRDLPRVVHRRRWREAPRRHDLRGHRAGERGASGDGRRGDGRRRRRRGRRGPGAARRRRVVAAHGAERGLLLFRLADLIERDLESFATLEALDVGRPAFEPRAGRHPRRGRRLPPLRRLGRQDRGPLGRRAAVLRPAAPGLHGARADRRGRRDHRLELADADRLLEARAGPRGRQHGGAQAGGGRAAEHAPARRADRRGRLPGRRGQRRPGARRGPPARRWSATPASTRSASPAVAGGRSRDRDRGGPRVPAGARSSWAASRRRSSSPTPTWRRSCPARPWASSPTRARSAPRDPHPRRARRSTTTSSPALAEAARGGRRSAIRSTRGRRWAR